VKTNDYGSYDPTPTMAKPHFKDIPNWLTGHLHIWDRRLDVYCCYVLQLSRSWPMAGLMIPHIYGKVWYALHIILSSINLVSCISMSDTRVEHIYLYVCTLVFCGYIHVVCILVWYILYVNHSCICAL
jgi:hypothetical protein